MPLLLRCVPVFQEIDCCCCTFSLRTGTVIIGIFILTASICTSFNDTKNLIKYKEQPYRNIKGTKGILIFSLVTKVTIAVLDLLLLFGVLCETPILMLPYLLIQPLILLLKILVYIPTEIMSTGRKNGGFLIVISIAIIGISTLLWMIQYNCYRQIVEKIYCTCGKAHWEPKVEKAYCTCGKTQQEHEIKQYQGQAPQTNFQYNTEDRIGGDYSALTGVVTMYALSVLNNENNHSQPLA